MRSTSMLPLILTGCTAFQSSRIANMKAGSSNDPLRRVPTQLQVSPTENDMSMRKTKEQFERTFSTGSNKRSSSLASTRSSDIILDMKEADETNRFSIVDSITRNRNADVDAASKVLSAALLVTGNTVGSGMFVIPDAVAGVGMVWGSALMLAIYVYNLISALTISEVAINLHRTTDCEVPSSFKEFADLALQDESVGNAISAASLIVNSCILAFAIVHAGSLITSIFPGVGLDTTMATGTFALVLTGVAATQTSEGLGKIANAAVVVLFSSFASVLLPGLAQVHDPVGTLLAPGTHPEGFGAALSAAAPILFSCAIYQNIVPSITKLLGYDRMKTTVALAIGSFLPIVMYTAWSLVVLGGGMDTSVSGGGSTVFTTFFAAALVGSCVACTMSLAEEYESLIYSFRNDEGGGEACPVTEGFSVPAVALSVAPPAIVALGNAGAEFTGALHFTGALVSPFLYGFLPIMLMQAMKSKGEDTSDRLPDLPLVFLGGVTCAFLGQELVQDISKFIS